MYYPDRELKLTAYKVHPSHLRWSEILCVGGILAMACSLSFGASPNQIKGSVQGQPLGQPATPLAGIHLSTLNSTGIERDACISDGTGGFLIKVRSEDQLYRLIVWDEFNRWWGRDISDLHNDGQHNNLGAITLRPQTSSLPNVEKREQTSIIEWLKKHNPLSAAMLELHLGAFDQPDSPSAVHVNGAGSANSSPLQMAWSADYHAQHPDVSIDYQSIASGGGIIQMTAGTVDFGSVDLSLTDTQLADTHQAVKQLPIALAGTVVVYSDKLPSGLRFSGPILAKIYLGEIKTWSDKELSAINPGKELPDWPIIPIHRSDGSAATSVFTNYLSEMSPAWKDLEGSNTQINWQGGVGTKGNEGISGLVKQTDGAIGYLDFTFAQQNKLRMAAIENASENFVLPSRDSISAAADALTLSELRYALKRPYSREAYPMASATWMLFPLNGPDPKKSLILLDYINFSFLGRTRSKVNELGYIPLPPALQDKTKIELSDIAARIVKEANVKQ